MKKLLLASLATGALALAAPAWAQVTEPVPSTPPIIAPEAQPEATPEERVGGAVRTEPVPQFEAQPQDQATAQANAEIASAETPAEDAITTQAIVPADAGQVCQPRVTSVHFGQRGAALTRENRNAIEHAVDAASVCQLEQVVISDSADGRVSQRRTDAVRATLLAQGVAAEDIVVDTQASAEGAETGQLNVRMEFAGVATAGTPLAMNEMAVEEPMQEKPAAESPAGGR